MAPCAHHTLSDRLRCQSVEIPFVANKSKPLLGSKVGDKGTSISIRKTRLLEDRDDLLDRFLWGDGTLEVWRILLELG